MKRRLQKILLAALAALLLLSGCAAFEMLPYDEENGVTQDWAEGVPEDAGLYGEDIVTGSEPLTTQTPTHMEVHFIDVGQGDATLVICDGEAMLIDAGENNMGTTVQMYLQKQGVEKLAYAIGTHPDSDHIGGLDVIITKFDCGMVMMPDYEKTTATYRDVVEAAEYKSYKIVAPRVGDTYTLGGATFTIIAPNDSYKDSNNSSIGILLSHGEKRFLFTGDAEEEAETDILKNGIAITADVLHVGHHGSRTASTEDFVTAVSPEYAVISCGEGNSYGHPHAAPLNTLREQGVKLFRTDEQGSIVAESDGETIIWNCAPTDSWQTGQ